jgi:hypothetical protein
VINHVDNQYYVIFNAKLCGKYFLEIFQKDMKGSIETADKFILIFPIEKEGESGSINFSHPPTFLQTNTTVLLIVYTRKKLKLLQHLNFPWWE